MYRMLRRKNEGLREDVAGFAQKLIRTPSVSLQEARVAELVEKQMREVGYDKVFRDECGNVVGILFGSEGERTILLNSHMDTVPRGREGLWHDSPYSGRIENRRIHGRGAADCKGGIAAQVFAGALLKRSLLPLRGNLVVAATVAEENGCSVGVRALIEKTLPELEMKPTFAILGEPTGLGLYYGHEGWLQLEVRVDGVDRSQVGNAATTLVVTSFDFPYGIACLLDKPGGAVVHRPRFEQVDGIRRATVPMDQQLRSGEDVGEVIGHTKQQATGVLQCIPNEDLAVDVLVEEEEEQTLYTGRNVHVRHVTRPWSTDPFHPFMDRTRQALAAAGCEVRPGKWHLDGVGKGTAGSLLVNEFKVPTVGYGPGEEEMAHAPNEYVEIDRLVEAVYGTTAIVHALIGIPVFGWTSDEI